MPESAFSRSSRHYEAINQSRADSSYSGFSDGAVIGVTMAATIRKVAFQTLFRRPLQAFCLRWKDTFWFSKPGIKFLGYWIFALNKWELSLGAKFAKKLMFYHVTVSVHRSGLNVLDYINHWCLWIYEWGFTHQSWNLLF